MNYHSFKIIALLAVCVALVFAGCQESLVSPAPDAPPSADDPMTESEFKQRMAEDGIVILTEDQYDQFGIELQAPQMVERMAAGETIPKTEVCTNRNNGIYNYSVCSQTTEERAFNADYYRVQIDAAITGDEICYIIPDPIDPIDGPVRLQEQNYKQVDADKVDASKDEVVCSTPTVSLASTTTRQDNVVLQNNVTDSGVGSAGTSFVAFYPQADNFTFNHTSTFDQPSDQISVSVTPQ